MKSFKFKFTKLITWLMIAAIALSAFGIAVNIYRICITLEPTTYDYITFIMFFIVCAMLIAIILGMFISSKYTITEEKIISSFGFIKSEVLIKDIQKIVVFKKINKLVIYFSEEKFTVIVVRPEWYDEFVSCLLEKNKNIVYECDSVYEDDKDDKKGR